MIDIAIFVAAASVSTAFALLVWRRVTGPAPSAARAALRGGTVLFLALLLVGFGAWKLSNARTIQAMGQIVPRVATADSLVAITFDDGPLPGATGRILEALAAEEVRATFFLNGGAIEQHPEAARQIVEAGHEIGNHSFTHPVLLGLSLARIREEIERTDEQIRSAGYTGPIHFRSPYGKKFVALPYYLARNGRTNVFWDVEPESDPAVAADSARIVEHVLDRTRPGSIILLHVMTRAFEPSRAAVPAILRGLKDHGYRFVTVSELIVHGGEDTAGGNSMIHCRPDR